LVSGLVWAGWCWFIVREKHCWLTDLGWLKPTNEQAKYVNTILKVRKINYYRLGFFSVTHYLHLLR